MSPVSLSVCVICPLILVLFSNFALRYSVWLSLTASGVSGLDGSLPAILSAHQFLSMLGGRMSSDSPAGSLSSLYASRRLTAIGIDVNHAFSAVNSPSLGTVESCVRRVSLPSWTSGR